MSTENSKSDGQRTVYILGAGASHGSRLVVKEKYIPSGDPPDSFIDHDKRVPLSKEFFHSFSERANVRYADASRELVKFIARHFAAPEEARSFYDLSKDNPREVRGNKVAEFFASFAEKKNLDIEDVFTRLQAEIDRHPTVSPDLLRARDQLKVIIIRKLGEACAGHHSLEYLKLCDLLTPQDAVITFNWDDLLDAAFLAVPKGREALSLSLTAVSPTDIPRSTWDGTRLLKEQDDPANFTLIRGPLLLKLHGSVTWFSCPRSDCPAHSLIYHATKLGSEQASKGLTGDPKRTPDHLAYDTDNPPSCPYCGVSMQRVIVPPIISKPYEAYPSVRRSWALAHQALKHAGRIVCIGYSFREADVYSNWLLASSLRRWRAWNKTTKPEIEVVNRTEKCDRKDWPANRVRRLLGDWVTVKESPMTFTEWIDKQEGLH